MGPAADPFSALTGELNDVKEKIAYSNLESFKAGVEHTNHVKELSYQQMIHEEALLSTIHKSMREFDLALAIANANDVAAVRESDEILERLALEQSIVQRDLANEVNTQNLNTALIIGASTYVGGQGQYAELNLAYGGAMGSVQATNLNSVVNAAMSAVSTQGIINTGNIANTVQTSNPTSI